ncbi:hypothetical protein A2976_02540 [candidate division WWE3 bacterium RIFCSPLOWO2_01_FULL_41_9]|uniref:Peptidoglycan glycosyltransferase n=1 Tax=candidate division WWE3 bacterium RIFCSPLOWO2_01_FULL_41_9 TaxID=1802626 RepID=A0A1F4VKD6_UNCKA|nr:MAG: hypothetical protein A2976_02540 [candidate division WWE3 bacterium RIFCSPLOWO2_01_FULL_41_9]
MRKKRATNENFRLNILIGFFLSVSVVFVLRLFFIQVVGHEKYKALAQDQYWNLQDIPARRGNIMSRDGFVLATTQTHYLMYLEPQKIENKDKVIRYLSDALVKINAEREGEADILKSGFEKKIANLLDTTLQWVILEHNLTPYQKEDIESLNLVGVGFEEEPVRYYPEGTLASHVLGFVASNERGDKQGYEGIEGKLDADLKGKPGRIVEEKDAMGAPILVGGYTKVPPINGRDIVLTLDRSVQYIIEKHIKNGVEMYDAVSGSVIVMDPTNGEVIAMANYPTYDPANFTDEEKETTQSPHRKSLERKNLSISETYEPGSVMKPLTVSAAVDLKKVTLSTSYEDYGPVYYSGHKIDNWDGKHHGTMNIVQLLQKSNNIGAAWVGHLVGSENLSEYMSNFGLGNKGGIDLEGEDTGILRDYSSWTDIDLANIAFGQGISVTPLQMLDAFNTIANGGELFQPKVILEIRDEGKVLSIPPKNVRRVISKETSDTMVNMLIQAVEGGESKFFNLKDYKIAGKTGTAQIPVRGEYDPTKTNATFIGFLPETKKFSMIVRLDRPSTSPYAAETAVPLWMSITDELVKYYGIPPDNTIGN